MNLLARDASPPSEPMESLSITHRDYRQEGFHPEPLPPTQVRGSAGQSSSQAPHPFPPGHAPVAPLTSSPLQPHDYRLEQPQTFWLEHAQQVPGTSSIRTGDTPFRKCAMFTTPVSECLDQP
ncbi:LOW QUALITY PROTEIN: sperm-associated antigen 8 [Notechis scutatus]|uniref:LOW QUALITY PROTEIN: sperm-associated antigen 8 n=1 Tax=Notechis scutatus TaxID=8663 RepID=A0A6J1VJC3_9SAUR|nr:LOW QUALITY PROTEIN: sperm-associated antigen 8 [Notechis scutatus]